MQDKTVTPTNPTVSNPTVTVEPTLLAVTETTVEMVGTPKTTSEFVAASTTETTTAPVTTTMA